MLVVAIEGLFASMWSTSMPVNGFFTNLSDFFPYGAHVAVSSKFVNFSYVISKALFFSYLYRCNVHFSLFLN